MDTLAKQRVITLIDLVAAQVRQVDQDSVHLYDAVLWLWLRDSPSFSPIQSEDFEPEYQTAMDWLAQRGLITRQTQGDLSDPEAVQSIRITVTKPQLRRLEAQLKELQRPALLGWLLRILPPW